MHFIVGHSILSSVLCCILNILTIVVDNAQISIKRRVNVLQKKHSIRSLSFHSELEGEQEVGVCEQPDLN